MGNFSSAEQNRLSKEVVELLTVQVFKKRVNSSVVVSGHGGDRLIVGPRDLSDLFQS